MSSLPNEVGLRGSKKDLKDKRPKKSTTTVKTSTNGEGASHSPEMKKKNSSEKLPTTTTGTSTPKSSRTAPKEHPSIVSVSTVTTPSIPGKEELATEIPSTSSKTTLHTANSSSMPISSVISKSSSAHQIATPSTTNNGPNYANIPGAPIHNSMGDFQNQTAGDFIMRTLAMEFREHTSKRLNDILKFASVSIFESHVFSSF